MLNEKFLHAVWKYALFNQEELKTISNKKIEILYCGEHNQNAGPDFLNAKIKVDDIIWCGNIEIHYKTSDFLKHQHHHDTNYSSLVLHVVYEHDKHIDNNCIETIVLKNYIPIHVLNQYHNLSTKKEQPACTDYIDKISEFIINHWVQRMTIERLETKVNHIQDIFVKTKDYQETFYRLFCRHLGFKVNNDLFEKLSENISLNILLKNSYSLELTESLIYGCAGFLETEYTDRYLIHLQNEFSFLKKKYNIQTIQAHLWKFARMRPANFPSVRLHQLALFIHYLQDMWHNPSLFFLERKNLEKLQMKPIGYFANHLTFEEEKTINKKYRFGQVAIQNILINVVVPYLFFYGKSTGNDTYCDLALNYLESIKPEINSITKKFPHIKLINASQSQGILQLFNFYCKEKRCAECSIGIHLMKS